MWINWEAETTEILMNPRLPEREKESIQNGIASVGSFKSHVWVSTSGTTSVAKWAALSKQAILCSANAVNRHLQVQPSDRWINPLPDFHVGGLGIWARSYLSGSSCIPFKAKWEADTFYEALQATQATLTSLVPAQVHDLVQLQYKSPVHLRAVVVGGGRMSDVLYQAARKLGWPLLPSYGLTECCSQVATAEICGATSRLHILDHVEVRITSEGLITLKSPALLTAYALIAEEGKGTILTDPKQEGWYITNDRGILSGNYLEVLGRQDDMIKIGGENVDFAHLERILDNIKGSHEMALVPIPDERLGNTVHLCVTGQSIDENVVEQFNLRVLPYERIRKVHYVRELPKTLLGKLHRQKLILSVMESGVGCCAFLLTPDS